MQNAHSVRLMSEGAVLPPGLGTVHPELKHNITMTQIIMIDRIRKFEGEPCGGLIRNEIFEGCNKSVFDLPRIVGEPLGVLVDRKLFQTQ
jgi:hypothetical protein